MPQSNENRTETIQIDSNDSTAATSFASCGKDSASLPPALNGVGDLAQNESIGPFDSSSSDNILVRLNDDCMINAFEFLPLSDLCNVADVCRVFEANALSVFKRRHSDLDLDELLGANDRGNEYDSENDFDSSGCDDNTDSEDESVPLRLLEMKTVEKLFLHFGAFIQTFDLDVEDEDQRDKVFEMLATYCAHEDAELKKLKMTDVTIGPDYIPRIQSLFDRVKVLDVTGGEFSTVYIGAELTELILEDIHLPEDVTWKFEKLQTLSLIDVHSDSGAIESLLYSNPQVKRLIITSTNWYFWWNVLRMSLELEELELDVPLNDGELDDYDYLARLQHLRVFTFNCKGWSSSMREVLKRFVKYNLPIDELSLNNFTLDSNACLTGLSKLKKLSLSDGGWHEMVQLSNVIKGLPNLEKLYLIVNFGSITIDDIKATIENAPKLNEFFVNVYDKLMGPIENPEICQLKIRTKDYLEINQLVQKRSDMTKLKLELTGTAINFNVPEYIVERSKSWLEVVIVTCKDVENIDVIDYNDFSDERGSKDESGSSDDTDSSLNDV